MKILLIQPRSNDYYKAFLPLGLAYVAAALRSNGHEITVWDINVAHAGPEASLSHIQSCIFSYDLVGITALTGDYPNVKWLVSAVKQERPDVKIVLGGHLPSSLPRFLMERLPVDFVVRGEGEETAVELARALESGGDFSAIRGLYFRDGSGEIVATSPRPRAADLKHLPIPPWDLFPMETYLKSKGTQNRWYYDQPYDGEMSIMAGRGCPYRCNYCDHTVKGHRVRYRPVARVIDEIKKALAMFGDKINVFYFWDDIFVWDAGWTLEFCDALARENLNIRWTCNCHVNRVTPHLMDAMKAAGCENVRFGIESGSQKILDALDKSVTVENALESLKICINAGLTLTLYIMVGGPGETAETIGETIDFFEKLIQPATVWQIARIHFFLLTPFPGTRLYEKVKQNGRIGDLDQFLQRGFNAKDDLPMNLSACSDRELMGLKEHLQEKVAQIREKQTMRLCTIVLEMKHEARP